jgi:Mn-dependent DtxR family transcriptional regulator
LGLLFRLEERQQSSAATVPLIGRALDASSLRVRLALARLRAAGLVTPAAAGFGLSDVGRHRGADLVRTHRLWESFLHQHLPLAADHVHDTAEQLEHLTDGRMQVELAEATGKPALDPHGKVIPGGRDEETKRRRDEV